MLPHRPQGLRRARGRLGPGRVRAMPIARIAVYPADLPAAHSAQRTKTLTDQEVMACFPEPCVMGMSEIPNRHVCRGGSYPMFSAKS